MKKTKVTEKEIKESLDELDKEVGDVLEGMDKPEDDMEDKEEKEEGCSGKSYKMKKEQVEALQNLVAEQKDIPQELASKLVSMFEMVVIENVQAIEEELQKEYETKLEEQIEANIVKLAEEVDEFLGVKTEEWIKENEASIVSKIQIERAEKMLEGLKNLFVENNVSYDEAQIDLVEEKNKEVEAIKAQLDESNEVNLSLKKEIEVFRKSEALKETVEGLPETHAIKVEKLMKEYEDLALEDYKVKLSILKESVSVGKQEAPKTVVSEVVLVEEEKTKPARSLVEILFAKH